MPRKSTNAADSQPTPEQLDAKANRIDFARRVLNGYFMSTGEFEVLDAWGYLTHLTIELRLKAHIAFRGARFPRVHGLEDLFNEVIRLDPQLENPEWRALIRELNSLGDPNGGLRYPQAHGSGFHLTQLEHFEPLCGALVELRSTGD